MGTINLAASATREIKRDVMTVVFNYTEQHDDSATLRVRLTEIVNRALAVIKPKLNGSKVKVDTSNYSIAPYYSGESHDVFAGFRGSVDVTVSGTDMQAIGDLSMNVPDMTIAQMDYSLSRRTREAAQKKLTVEAISSFKDQAAQYAQLLAGAAYSIDNVGVGIGSAYRGSFGASGPTGASGSMKYASSVGGGWDTEVTAGTETVSVSVSGTILIQEQGNV